MNVRCGCQAGRQASRHLKHIARIRTRNDDDAPAVARHLCITFLCRCIRHASGGVCGLRRDCGVNGTFAQAATHKIVGCCWRLAPTRDRDAQTTTTLNAQQSGTSVCTRCGCVRSKNNIMLHAGVVAYCSDTHMRTSQVLRHAA